MVILLLVLALGLFVWWRVAVWDHERSLQTRRIELAYQRRLTNPGWEVYLRCEELDCPYHRVPGTMWCKKHGPIILGLGDRITIE